jgi:thiol:disulfide interchange protein/DsbC/DsbD-like thiol-disulfide interchange protein
MIGIKRILFALLLLVAGEPLYAQLPGAPLNVPATLEAESAAPAPGQRVTIAFHFKPKPTWHGYWENPGDAGFGMQLKWDLPKGVSAGALHYPVPEPLIISGLMNHVYESEYAVLVDLEFDTALPVGARLPIKVRGDWLACTRDICVPEGDDLAIDLVVGSGRVNAVDQNRFDIWRAALPLMMDQNALYAIKGNVIDIAIPFAKGAAVDRPYFFAKTERLFRYAAPQSARRTGNWLVISGQVDKGFDGPIEGVLRIGEGQGLSVLAKPAAIPTGGDMVQTQGQITQNENPDSRVNLGGILGLLGLAILGGLILNLMPCVFPILGLKALALAKMGGDERRAKVDALAYAAGVILSCIALGGVMLALRSAGQQVGWAFQLQEPRIVLLLLLLMVAITLNLFGTFALGNINAGDALTRQSGVAGSFWTGVLAAVVATPCTGPFMAAALGAALLLPVLPALLLFGGLGLGLALPYLAIAFIPAVRRMLPKPGPWLERFRYIMGVPMALTALALLWLLWRLSGTNGLLLGVITGVLLLGLLVAFGKMQLRGGGSRFLPILAAIVLAIGATVLLPAKPVAANKEAGDRVLQTEPFSETRLAGYRAQGHPVFVYFTADWCVTCKVNEAAALQRIDTAKAFKAKGIKVLEGDFTRRDAEISRFLAQHGRSGVPLYLYYPKDGQAQVLPQVLTSNMLIELP